MGLCGFPSLKRWSLYRLYCTWPQIRCMGGSGSLCDNLQCYSCIPSLLHMGTTSMYYCGSFLCPHNLHSSAIARSLMLCLNLAQSTLTNLATSEWWHLKPWTLSSTWFFLSGASLSTPLWFRFAHGFPGKIYKLIFSYSVLYKVHSASQSSLGYRTPWHGGAWFSLG